MCNRAAAGKHGNAAPSRRPNAALHAAAFEKRLRQPEKRSGNRSFRTVQDKIGPARTKRYFFVTTPFGAISTPETSFPVLPESVPTEIQ